MNRNHISENLINRESGQTSDLSVLTKRWSGTVRFTQPTQILQFSYNILSIHHKQNFMAIVTRTGEAFLYNSFFPNSLERLLDSSSHILKLAFLENQTIFLIVKPKRENYLKFLILHLSTPSTISVSALSNLNLAITDLDHFDSYSNNLVLACNHKFIVYDYSSGLVKFERNGVFLYIKDSVISVSKTQSRYEIEVKCLKSGLNSLCFVNDCSHLKIIDLLSNFLVFSQNSRLNYVEFGGSEVHEFCPIPKKYFIGTDASVSVFDSHIVIMNKDKPIVDLVPKVLNSDLPGIFIVYEKIRSRVVILKDNGEILQTFTSTSHVKHLSINLESLELVLGCQDTIQIFH